MGVDLAWFVVNIVGNFGVFLTLAAYVALQLEKVDPNELSYLLPNLCGSLFVCASLVFDFNLPATVIEACWVLISLFGLAKLAWRTERRTCSYERSPALVLTP